MIGLLRADFRGGPAFLSSGVSADPAVKALPAEIGLCRAKHGPALVSNAAVFDIKRFEQKLKGRKNVAFGHECLRQRFGLKADDASIIFGFFLFGRWRIVALAIFSGREP